MTNSHNNLIAPKIAIIGAPNVGKSTFFNKILGGRRSIVEDLPGVTRDRIYADINLGNYHASIDYIPATFIDTGGLFFEEDTIYDGVQKQALLAVEEADLILMMVNARDGLTSTDQKIAQLLQTCRHKVLLIANKIDHYSLEHLSGDYYRLGLGEPIPFSSLGETFYEYMEKLIDHMLTKGLIVETEAQINNTYKDIPKIAILGKPNTGKSSILNELVGYERALVSDQAGTTRDALDTLYQYGDQEMLLIDTAGLRRKTKITGDIERYMVDRSIKSMVRADVSVLVIDVSMPISHQEEVLASLIQKRHKGCVLVLNKWDLIEEKNYEEKIKQIRRELPFIDYAPIVITSAKTGQRINQIIEKALLVHENLHKRIKTNILNTALREITTLKKVNSKLKVYYMTQVDINPITFTLFVNKVKLVDKNYLQFLERTLRAEFDFEGVPFQWQIKVSQ